MHKMADQIIEGWESLTSVTFDIFGHHPELQLHNYSQLNHFNVSFAPEPNKEKTRCWCCVIQDREDTVSVDEGGQYSDFNICFAFSLGSLT